jgi:hypothetical protein
MLSITQLLLQNNILARQQILIKMRGRHFSKKSAKQRYQYLVIVRDKIIQMFGGLVFQQMIGIPIGTNCASLLADLFLNAYKMISFKGFSKIKKENWCKPLRMILSLTITRY